MNLLKTLEKKLEAMVEGVFSTSFKASAQPIEIAKKLASVMDEEKIIGIARIYAPNKYTVSLSRSDKKHISSFEEGIITELQDFLISSAQKNRLSLIGKPEIIFISENSLKLGQFDVKAELSGDLKQELEKEKISQGTIIMPRDIIPKVTPQEKSKPGHYLSYTEKNLSKNYRLNKNLTKVGRSKTNDISLADSEISRHHIELILESDKVTAVDVGSTNGTFVNGKKIKNCPLNDGDSLMLGKTKLVYRSGNA